MANYFYPTAHLRWSAEGKLQQGWAPSCGGQVEWRDVPQESKPPAKPWKLTPGEELWDADPNCDHELTHGIGGGIKCKKCHGWCCY